MDLAHEREIKVLQRRITSIEDQKHPNILQTSSNISPSMVSPTESIYTQKSVLGDEHINKGSSYDLKFSKINMAMKRLQNDIKYSELMKTRQQF